MLLAKERLTTFGMSPRDLHKTFAVRPLALQHRRQWLSLWQGYLTFHETELTASLIDLTWNRLLDPEAPIRGHCAASSDRCILGIVHYLFHPVTWRRDRGAT